MPCDLDIAFLVPGLPFRGDTLEKSSLGGSETAGLCLARSLAALGHHVQMFSNCDAPGLYDGVQYRHTADFAAYATKAPHDVTVIQRAPELFAAKMNSRLNVLWCHDLAVGRAAGIFRSALWNVDKVAVLSDFMLGQYRDVIGGPAEQYWKTSNGIDLDMFPGRRGRQRTKLIYGARPERGLDVLLESIFPALLDQEPNLKLYIASYSNAVAHMASFYARIERLIDGLGDRVEFLKPLTKREYYKHLSAGSVYVYPTPGSMLPAFAEVSCITAMECQAAGLPIVTSARGALPETIAPDAGRLIDGDPKSVGYRDAFVEAVLRYVRDDRAWADASRAGIARSGSLTWDGVAQQWSADLERFIYERNESPARLVRHFIKRSDIMAARAVLDDPKVVSTHSVEELRPLRQEIQQHWAFAETPDGLQEQYEKIGLTHTDVFFESAREPRFALLKQWLADRPELARVLDYGCAHGSYAVNLSNQVGREWVGVDIDKHSIRWAEHNRDQRAATPGALTFRAGTHDVDLSDQKPFDCLMACEVLEHVPDPTVVIDRLERWIRPDGVVLITVPFGPWEWMSYKTYPYRCHLWEFDLHDLRDMFGKKKDLRISAFPVGMCDELQEQLGWHVVEYRVDGTPTGTIDIARKVRLQRPRQTVAAVLIAGPGSEATLRWALEPAAGLVDEIIIGDCGMSEEALAIVTGGGAVVVPASNPLETGFETPRNEALARARSDWVLWWDTDERIVGADKLNKYLRQNLFGGYMIRQHNFNVVDVKQDTTPVRLFRRTPRADGTAMRWYGMVHEHPEFGINEGQGQAITLRDVHIAHVGYIAGDDQVARFHRNWPLLEKDQRAYPERKLQKHLLCRDYIVQAKWALKASGGEMTDDVEAMCREVLRLYREFFLGQGTYMNADTLEYYSEALRLLGEGVEVTFAFAPTEDADGPIATTARFASVEEAERELAWRVRAAMGPRLSPYW